MKKIPYRKPEGEAPEAYWTRWREAACGSFGTPAAVARRPARAFARAQERGERRGFLSRHDGGHLEIEAAQGAA